MIKRILAGVLFLLLIAGSYYIYSRTQSRFASIDKILEANIHLQAKGVYFSGDCVPVPDCPSPHSHPSIYVLPVSVSSGSTGSDIKTLKPVISFNAFATGNPAAVDKIRDCIDNEIKQCTNHNDEESTQSNLFWRVCLVVASSPVESGKRAKNNNPAVISKGMIAVFTQCESPDTSEIQVLEADSPEFTVHPRATPGGLAL